MIVPLLLALSLPQVEPSQGLLHGAALTLAVDAPTALAHGLSASAVYYKHPGVFNNPPVAPGVHPSPPPAVPDFSAPDVPWNVPNVRIDAFSTNLNYIPANSDGEIVYGYDWAGVAFSTTRGTDNSGAHVFEYLFDGSQVATPVGVVVRSMHANEVSLSQGEAPPEIVAMDVYVPAILHQPAIVGILHGDFSGVVFSVTDDSNVPPAWVGGSPPPEHPGRLLFSCGWDGFAWSGPTLHPANLGLAPGDELVALAWHHHSGANFLAFSSDKATQDPVMFVDLAGTTGPTPLVYPPLGPGLSPTKVSAKMKTGGGKVRVDDIDALSVFDPRDFQALRKVIGSTLPDSASAELNVTLFRDIQYSNGAGTFDDLVTCMTAPSWITAATAAVVYSRLPGATPVLHGMVAMPPASEGTQYRISGVLTPVLIGIPLEVMWVAVNDGLEPVATSPWVQIGI